MLLTSKWTNKGRKIELEEIDLERVRGDKDRSDS